MKTIIRLFLLPALLLLACGKNSTSSQDGQYSGTVKLSQGSDHANVVISLYETPPMDSVLSVVRAGWPQLAFNMTARDFFDHREQAPAQQTTTAGDGSWSMTAPKASYCLVAAKEGFGWSYVFDVQPGAASTQTLYPETVLSGFIQDAVSLQSGRHYIVDRDLTILTGGALIMDGGAWLRLNRGVSVICEGNFFVAGLPDNLARITSNYARLSDGDWNAIKLTNADNVSMIGAKIGYGSNSLSIKNCRSTLIQNCIFHDAKYAGILLNQANDCEISRNLFIHNTEGVYCLASQNVLVNNNIFVKNDQGMETEESTTDIFNNMIRQNDMGVHSQFRPSPTIYHNEFSENDNGVFCAGSGPLIKLNNFTKNTIGIYIGIEYSSIDSDPVIQYNNFNDKTWAVKIYGFGSDNSNLKNVTAMHNYWSSASVSVVNRVIWDKNDAAMDSLYTGSVLYNPYLTTLVDSAGIKN